MGRPGGGPQDGHRFPKAADPDDRLVEEARHPDAGGAVEQNGPGLPMGGGVEGRSEAGEGLIAPDEPRARIACGHGGILRAASARLAA